MTKEIKDILAAYKAALAHGRQTALATVVHVEGSSYRRPGARMLIEDNGQLTGAISGGCLEGDALRKALQAINLQQNKLVTYNSMHEEDIDFGVQLGCNGIVHILFEPIDPADENNPVSLLEKAMTFSGETVLVTLFSLQWFNGHQPGTCFLLNKETSQSNIADTALETAVRKDAADVLQTRTSIINEYNEFSLSSFVELLQPSVSLVVIGAGNDVFPLAEMAGILGWKITIADGRSTHANKQRFPNVHTIITGKPEAVIEQLAIDDWTVFLLMTHNYNYDLAMIRLLLSVKCSYIGTLGPKKRLDRMLNQLQQEGLIITDEQKANIYGPTGLDIGAETAEEIALSILAEIKAVFADRQGHFLRNRSVSIHIHNEIALQHASKNEN
jgi:xanthine/CO dehydrogenase XdhC/CoxF family maturation factor